MTGSTIRAGVMGWPVAHSRSPRLHGHWLARHGIDGSYQALAVAPEALAIELAALAGRGFAGVNLTVPHKQAALGLMASLSPAAAAIGAVNTVVVGAGGALAGDNSDGFGFLENLRHGTPGWSAAAGAGGGARARAARRARSAMPWPGQARPSCAWSTAPWSGPRLWPPTLLGRLPWCPGTTARGRWTAPPCWSTRRPSA